MGNKLCLGTVQLGLKYGIKNALDRKPTDRESFFVLQQAIDSGIEFFDTASAYGTAEELLGRFGIGNHSVKVISKLSPDIYPDTECVLREIECSLQRIGIPALDGYMLHRAENFYEKNIVNGLLKAKSSGLIRHIGVSIYEPKDALNVVRDARMDYIQIPYNVFDQRLDNTDFFELAEKNNVKVFARSAFLQGLLLMNPNQIPDNLKIAQDYIEDFQSVVRNYGYEPAEAAFLFSSSHRGIYKTVFGVDTQDQLKDNLRYLEKSMDFAICRKVLTGRYKKLERKIITPSLW